jgi:hypothetical protein
MSLPTARGVTLCAVSSVGLEATVWAMRRSREQVRFDHALLLSHAPPEGLATSGIEWRRIDPLGSKADYSRFMLHELADHITTSHVLIVQWDGFIRDGSRWQDQFLDYDYIGAVWPQFEDAHKVGNGGFSLRSKRLLDATRQIPAEPEPEDVLICRRHRHMLEADYEIRFADSETARLFSYEREGPADGEFGFHGAYNLLSELPVETTMQLVGSLELGVLGARESVELLFDALKRSHFDLARIALEHVRAHPRVLQRLWCGFSWSEQGRRQRAAGGGR